MVCTRLSTWTALAMLMCFRIGSSQKHKRSYHVRLRRAHPSHHHAQMATAHSATLSTMASTASTALALSRAQSPAHLRRLCEIDVKRTRAANFVKERYSHGQLCEVAVDVLRGVVGQRVDECHPADVWQSTASYRKAAATLRGIAYALDGPEPCHEISNKIATPAKRARTAAQRVREPQTVCSVMSPTEPYDWNPPADLRHVLADDSPMPDMPALTPQKTRRSVTIIVDLTDGEERCECELTSRYGVGGC
jgi:hypothetical protein